MLGVAPGFRGFHSPFNSIFLGVHTTAREWHYELTFRVAS